MRREHAARRERDAIPAAAGTGRRATSPAPRRGGSAGSGRGASRPCGAGGRSCPSRWPFQQSGKLTCSWSFDAAGTRRRARGRGDRGGAAARRHRAVERRLDDAQSQNDDARALRRARRASSPATIVSPAGYGLHRRVGQPAVVDDRAARDRAACRRRSSVGAQYAAVSLRGGTSSSRRASDRERREGVGRDVADEGVVVRRCRAGRGQDDRVVGRSGG